MSENGENQSFLGQVEEIQSKYENNRLPAFSMPGPISEYNEYLSYDKQKLKALSIEDCSIISLRLSQYALYIQRCYNKIISSILILEAEIDSIIATKAHSYFGQWAHQRLQAIKDNTRADELNNTLIDLKQKKERFEHMALCIKNLSDQFKNLKFDKIKQRQS